MAAANANRCRRARPSSTARCCARASSARAALGRGDVPDRPGRGRPGRAAVGGAAAVRARGRSRHADRRGAPRARRQAARSARSIARRCRTGRCACGRRRRGGACRSRDGSLDLVVSALALQFVNDLPGTLIQIRRALKPDGLFLAALIGGDTLTELRQAFAASRERDRGRRVAAGRAVRRCARARRAAAARRLCAAGGRYRPVTVRYAIAVRADARPAPHGRDQRAARAPPHAAPARDLAAHGGNLCASALPIADGRVRATFEIVWLSGWAPHESQQQPLKPGSARAAARRCARHAGDPGGREAAALSCSIS